MSLSTHQACPPAALTIEPDSPELHTRHVNHLSDVLPQTITLGEFGLLTDGRISVCSVYITDELQSSQMLKVLQPPPEAEGPPVSLPNVKLGFFHTLGRHCLKLHPQTITK